MTANTHIPGLLLSRWQEQTFHYFREGIEICTLHEARLLISPSSISPSSILPSSISPGTATSGSISSGTAPPPYQDVDEQPVIALLRYQAGARVPRHRHRGIETILVLTGTQSDEAGCYETGSLVINPVGSEHSVWSEQGCVVLVQWDKAVEFI